MEEIREFLKGKFYIDNLTNKFDIENKAIDNLINLGYTLEELKEVKNYNEIGIVECVANDDFIIYNNEIKSIEEIEERIEELEKEIEYEEKKLDICAYGTSDLMYIEGLKSELEELNSII